MNPFEDLKSLPPIADNLLPSDSGWLFPEYRFEQMNLEEYASVIIERVLERGSWRQIRWLFKTFKKDDIAEWVRLHGFRLLSKRSFAMWCNVLHIQSYVAPDWARAAKEMEPW